MDILKEIKALAETDTNSYLDRARQEGKQVYIPTIVGQGQPLQFAEWAPTATIRLNRFGIGESTIESDQWIEAKELQLVIVPMVAFDERCNRIGMGGGYYDRTFSWLNDSDANRKEWPVLIGLA